MSGKNYTGTYSSGITLTDSAYNPVTVAAGASITNPAGAALIGTASIYWTIGNLGAIDGYSAGVSLAGTGTVVNQGTIGASQTAGNGYSYNSTTQTFIPLSGGVIMAGGGISNAVTAAIGNYFEGVAIGGAGSVTNAGSIGAGSTKSGFGVVLVSGGSVSDDATGVITGGRYAILSLGSHAATVANQGMISGGAGIGVILLGGGTVNNAAGGTISGGFAGVFSRQGGDVTNDATGRIYGAYFGVELTNAAGSVTNLGSISSSQTSTRSNGFDAAGVDLGAGGSMTNGVSGNIRATWKGVEIGAVISNIGGTLLNQGFIYASNTDGSTGAAVWAHGPAVIDNTKSGTIAGGPYGIVLYNQATVANQGSIGGTEFAVFEANGGYGVRVVASPGAVFSGLVEGSSTSSAIRGTLELASGATAGTIVNFRADTLIGGNFSGYMGFGEVLLDGGAAWSFGGTVSAPQTMAFGGSSASLTLLNPASMAGTITGFGAGDTIELAGITDVTGVSLASSNLLTISESTGPGLTLQFDPSQRFFSGYFNYAVTGGGTSLTVPCFAAGTRIATPRGAIVVEQLREGDEVLTVSGGRQRIQWIGHRRVDCRRHPDRPRVLPFRIMPHALGDGRPNRPQLRSPDHAVFVEDVLIPIKFLLTDSTIAQIEVDHISYYHIELPRHDVVLAENMPAETYLETGGRSAFENAGGAMQLHPDFEPEPARVGMVWKNFGYAPLLGENGELERARVKLAWQARMLASPAPRRRKVR